MEMKSLERKSSLAVEESKERKYYPSITLNYKALSGLKGKEINDKVTLLVECEVKGISQYGNGDIECTLDLLAGTVYKKKEED